MAMTRSQFTSLLVEGLREVFFNTYKEPNLIYQKIFDVQKSNKYQEVRLGVAGLGMLAPKGEAEPIVYEDATQGYTATFTHNAFAKGIQISRELIDDELYGVMKQMTKALARAGERRVEYDHASIFNNATSTAYTGADGLPLLSASHTYAALPGETWSNTSASTDLSLTALSQAFNAMRRYRDDKGQIIMLTPRTLLIPPELEMTAYEILNSVGKPYTADNEVNFFKGKLDVVVWNYLTDTNAWFVLCDKSEIAPVSFQRIPMEFDRDTDFETDVLRIKAYTRYSLGWDDARFIYGSMGSS